MTAELKSPVYLLLDERSVFGDLDLDHLLTVVGEKWPSAADLRELKDDWDAGVVVRLERAPDGTDKLTPVAYL
ncbi:MAG: hypothetical protein WDA03_13365 [Trueperaceae bacterium]